MSLKDVCTAIRTGLDQMRSELADLDAVERDETATIQRVSDSPACKDEVVQALAKIARERAISARAALGREMLSLAKSPEMFLDDGSRLLADRVSAHLERFAGSGKIAFENLETALLAVVGAEQIERAIRESADAVAWPDSIPLADRLAMIDAARQRRAKAVARIQEIHRQASDAGVLI